MLDEIVRSRPATPNRTIALLKKCCKRKRSFLMEDVFPGGWNSKIETNNTEYYPGPVQSALEKKEIIPGGWISQRKAANTKHHPSLLKDNMEEKEIK